MLKKVVQLFILVAGGMIGYLYFPEMNIAGFYVPEWFVPYLGMFIGALIFFFISLFLSDYIVNFLRFIVEKLVKAPGPDLLFGSMGLLLGLLIAFMINIYIQDLGIPVISEVLPIFVTVILGYLGFQVGFKRRNEFASMITRKETKEKDAKEDQ